MGNGWVSAGRRHRPNAPLVSREAGRQPGHLASQSRPGTTDMCRRLVHPGLDLAHLGAPQLCLVGAVRAPWFDDPGPVKEQPGRRDSQLGSPSELVSLGEVSGVTLHGRSCLVQVVGSGSQCLQRNGDRGHGAQGGVRVWSLADRDLSECVLQRLRVLPQSRRLTTHRPADA